MSGIIRFESHEAVEFFSEAGYRSNKMGRAVFDLDEGTVTVTMPDFDRTVVRMSRAEYDEWKRIGVEYGGMKFTKRRPQDKVTGTAFGQSVKDRVAADHPE